MKHPAVFKYLSSRVTSLSSEENIRISGFHPDLLLPFINLLLKRVFLCVADESFLLTTKHLSGLWDDDAVVFVGHR